MSKAEIVLFRSHLARSKSVLEFGAGGSTLLSFRLAATSVTTVESDNAWLDRLSEFPESQAATRAGRWQPIWANIGAVGKWGYPTDESAKALWPNYHSAVWDALQAPPDIVLVDGRFRVACALQAAQRAPGAIVAFHDFFNRRHYHVVLPFLRVLDKADSLAIMRAERGVSPDMAAEELARHWEDPR